MRIRNVLHKGLRRFIEDDGRSGIQAAVAEKLRRMMSFLQDMENETELKTVPSWKAHQLTGGPQGHMEPFRYEKLAIDVLHRSEGGRDH